MELVYFVVQQLQSFVGELVYLVWGRVLSQAGIKHKSHTISHLFVTENQY